MDNKKIDTQEPSSASKENQEKIQKLQIWTAVYTSIIVAVVGSINALTTSLLNTKIEEAKIAIDKSQQETQRQLEEIKNKFAQNQIFTQRIKESLNDLAGKDELRSKLALITLYPLTEDNNKNKCILINIAVASGKKELMDTISSLMKNDNIINNKNNIPCLQASINILATKADNRDSNLDENNKADITPKGIEGTILGQITPEKSSGWIFIGKINLQSQILEEETINTKNIPSHNSIVEVIDNVNLRNTLPNKSLGNIIGVVMERSKVKINNIVMIKNSLKNNVVWANIDILSKPND